MWRELDLVLGCVGNEEVAATILRYSMVCSVHDAIDDAIPSAAKFVLHGFEEVTARSVAKSWYVFEHNPDRSEDVNVPEKFKE